MNRSIDVQSGSRSIRGGNEYEHLFPIPDRQDKIIIKDGEVDDTVQLMAKVVWRYIDDTKKLASKLKRNSLEATCRGIWEFIYHHIQYKLDKQGLEQLRRPARSWFERRTGVDCDCMSIFASSILTNLQIPHSFRITRYSADYWQHVYVVVPKGNGEEIIIDAVLSSFDYQKPYTAKKDYAMNLNGINIAVLSGIDGNDLYDLVIDNNLGLGELDGTNELDLIYKNLVSTRNAIRQNPSLIASSDNPESFLQMVDYAIQYFYTPNREKALEILAQNENELNKRLGLMQFQGFSEDELEGLDDEFLGAVKVKNFFNSIKKGVQNAGKKVGNVAKKAVKAVVKFNPVTIVARSGFLLALKLNIKKMSSKLKWAYATEEQARKKGVSSSEWNKAKQALQNIEKLFADKLQGKRESLKNSILKGRAGGLNGELGSVGLGEPVTAATIAAATPVIIAALEILKKSGLLSPNEKIDANSVASEMMADPNSGDAFREIEATENTGDGGEYGSNALPLAPTPTTDPSPKDSDNPKQSTMSKMFDWIKANPLPSVAIAGAIGLGIYTVMKPKPVRSSGSALSGLGGTSRPKKRKSSKQKGTSSKTKVKTLLLQ